MNLIVTSSLIGNFANFIIVIPSDLVAMIWWTNQIIVTWMTVPALADEDFERMDGGREPAK